MVGSLHIDHRVLLHFKYVDSKSTAYHVNFELVRLIISATRARSDPKCESIPRAGFGVCPACSCLRMLQVMRFTSTFDIFGTCHAWPHHSCVSAKLGFHMEFAPGLKHHCSTCLRQAHHKTIRIVHMAHSGLLGVRVKTTDPWWVLGNGHQNATIHVDGVDVFDLCPFSLLGASGKRFHSEAQRRPPGVVCQEAKPANGESNSSWAAGSDRLLGL